MSILALLLIYIWATTGTLQKPDRTEQGMLFYRPNKKTLKASARLKLIYCLMSRNFC
jgi:hypothetical protein